jgi:hypothetical protein
MTTFGTKDCAQAGHVVSRKYSKALYNPAVVYASCQHCNGYLEGNHAAGVLHMCEDLGATKALSILAASMQNGANTFEELEDIEDGCSTAVEIMEDYYAKNANVIR